MFSAWVLLKKPDTSMAGNGLLAGLVAICAGVGTIDPIPAIIVGAVAGVVVVPAVLFIERVLKVDDPVGAVGVHMVSGLWGVLAAGIFVQESYLVENEVTRGSLIGTQVLGAVAIMVFVGVLSTILFGVLKAVRLLRVSAEEELEGLDVSEHGAPGYGPDMLTPASVSAMAS
jgi:Amt family ammonium transporter